MFDLYRNFCCAAIFQLSTVLTLQGGSNSLSDVWQFPLLRGSVHSQIQIVCGLELVKCKRKPQYFILKWWIAGKRCTEAWSSHHLHELSLALKEFHAKTWHLWQSSKPKWCIADGWSTEGMCACLPCISPVCLYYNRAEMNYRRLFCDLFIYLKLCLTDYQGALAWLAVSMWCFLYAFLRLI